MALRNRRLAFSSHLYEDTAAGKIAPMPPAPGTGTGQAQGLGPYLPCLGPLAPIGRVGEEGSRRAGRGRAPVPALRGPYRGSPVPFYSFSFTPFPPCTSGWGAGAGGGVGVPPAVVLWRRGRRRRGRMPNWFSSSVVGPSSARMALRRRIAWSLPSTTISWSDWVVACLPAPCDSWRFLACLALSRLVASATRCGSTVASSAGWSATALSIDSQARRTSAKALGFPFRFFGCGSGLGLGAGVRFVFVVMVVFLSCLAFRLRVAIVSFGQPRSAARSKTVPVIPWPTRPRRVTTSWSVESVSPSGRRRPAASWTAK